MIKPVNPADQWPTSNALDTCNQAGAVADCRNHRGRTTGHDRRTTGLNDQNRPNPEKIDQAQRTQLNDQHRPNAWTPASEPANHAQQESSAHGAQAAMIKPVNPADQWPTSNALDTCNQAGAVADCRNHRGRTTGGDRPTLVDDWPTSNALNEPENNGYKIG